jgi:ABC-type glycerol-3-phosphate transport system permease component
MLIAGIYLLLCAGGLTMVYPFGLMIAGSTKSDVDQKELQLIPGFLVDDGVLYRKFIQSLFNEDLNMLRMAYDSDVPSFEKIEPPVGVNDKLVEAWLAFVESSPLPDHTYALGHMVSALSSEVQPELQRAFVKLLKVESDYDLDRLNQTYGASFMNWQSIQISAEQYLMRRNKLSSDLMQKRLRDFKRGHGQEHRYYFSVEGFFKAAFLRTQYTRNIGIYNARHTTEYESYDQVHLPRRLPEGTDQERRDWEQFVRETLNLLWIRAEDDAAAPYRAFLKAKYRTIESLNRSYGTACRDFVSVPMIDEPPTESLAASDWASFIEGWVDPDTAALHILPAESMLVHSLDFQFRDHLQTKHGTIDRLNAAMGTSFGDFTDIALPQQAAHHTAFKKKVGALRWEFMTRNYRSVIGFMLLHGRAVLNTVIYCSLAVLTALIVNPMAAYALSRFKLPSAYMVLLFLMLTMAFPAMVNQIPQFLMLREFGMLNSYWALILPGLANGYSIFILKGFFDSQPRELYESASIDGAGEWILFWKITMNLSKPVLAYIALFAFTGAYSNFLFAMLICQDESMWTLMPMLYQLQQRGSEGIVFASLIIAAIPTFLVFLLAQNIIMRGIVVPVEK